VLCSGCGRQGVLFSCVITVLTKKAETDSFKCSRSNGAYRPTAVRCYTSVVVN